LYVTTTLRGVIGPFKIIGTAQGGNTFTTEWTFNITCGSETINSQNRSISYVFPRTGIDNSFT
jgi:hypothetical protein